MENNYLEIFQEGTMKTLRLFLFSFITLTIISNAQTVIPPGDVSGTWALGGSPYEIQGEITIPDGLTLTIEPGVLVEFQGHYKLNVQGRLLAVGTETDTITFTINNTTGFHDPNIPNGGWAGIRFINVFSMIDSSNITYCKIEYGKAIGSWPDNSGGAICVDGFDKLTIANCLITNNVAGGFDGPTGGGIALWNSNPMIKDNTISNNSAQFGGGIQFYESSPQIVNNIIVNNSAGAGGGIVFNGNSNPTIINATIDNNTATAGNGGGIASWGSNPSLINGTISGNTAVFWSGGIDCGNSNLSLMNVIVSGNTANVGGGIWAAFSDLDIDGSNFINNESITSSGGGIATRNSYLQIDSCTFAENTSGGKGGAIRFICADTLSALFHLTITNTSFENNIAVSGGGVYASNDDSTMLNVVIDKCELIDNTAERTGGLWLTAHGNMINFTLTNSIFTGNEVLNFTGGCSFNWCIGTVSNCLFASNIANSGGGNWNSGGVSVWSGSNVDFMNCTFADNSASYGAGLTVGMGGIATTTNCIFWGNSTDQIALDTLNGQGGTLTVNYCDIQGGENSVNVIDPILSTLTWKDGNIDADPFFVDPLLLDYHLQKSSPCIGTATDSIEINGIMCYCPPFDIEGNPRPNPTGSIPDMGAYESHLAVAGVEKNELVQPIGYALYQNYPNPFNPLTTIKYQIPELSFVTIKLFDLLGSEIATLVNEEKPIGSYEVGFDGVGLPSGVYFYTLQAGSFVETKKMVLMK
jgi:predicted outer membrane repeat protein